MSSFVARFRMFTALLLLLAGQLGVVASAQAATCRRAAAGQKPSVAGRAAADAAHAVPVGVRALLSDEHRHDEPSPGGDAAAIPASTSCTPAAALPERRADLPIHPGPAVRATARGESPPRDLLLSGFFRPPRLS